jgi:ribosomal protein RSM22 (predicted rRNA methylase)
VADLPDDLRMALADHLAAQPAERVRAGVARLIEAYRSGDTPSAPILTGPADVAAYAAYRMPATYAAVRRALGALAIPLDAMALAPRTHLDLGGGTGAAAWAAAEAFGSLAEITVLDQVGGALVTGAALARGAASPVVRGARWVTERLDGDAALPAADLVTASYLLGELTGDDQRALVARAAAAGRTVVFVEPGTPAGYRRILDARSQLLAFGGTVLAPCPHQAECPLAAGDWCHFAARVNRSALHRRVKDAELSFEDEKFAYVAVATAGASVPAGVAAPAGEGRIIRRPTRRKGMVALRLCRPDGTAGEQIVSKRHDDAYRRARDAAWGDAFPVR